MNIIRKIIALTLEFVILSGMYAFSAGVDDTRNLTPDGKECFEFLSATGIIGDDEIYNEQQTIGRGHFIKLSLGLAVLDTDILDMPVSGVFDDVDSSHKYASEIEAALKLGFISGSSADKFEPDSAVTFSQAVKIVCEIMDYTHIADSLGGYPCGYMSLASRLGITDTITLDSDDEMKMNDVMCLLKNAAEADVMNVSSFGENTQYIAYKGRNVLSERKGIITVEGVLNDNGITNMKAPESEIPSGCICIEETVLKDADGLAKEYFGYKVRAYYDGRADGTCKPVLYVMPCEDNTVTQCYDVDSIILNDGSVEYETDESTLKRIKLSDTASYILNGKMISAIADILCDVKKGSIKFVSNDGDRVADAVIITSYETHVLSGVSTASSLLVCEDGLRLELDTENKDFIFEIIKGNTNADISDIIAGNVILAAISSGEGINVKKILVSDKTVSGKVASVSDSSITVDSTEYKADVKVISKIKAGNRYLFKLDYFGNIVCAEAMANTVYGYLYGLKQENFGNVKCRIFTENNHWVELDFDSDVRFNGEPKTEEEAYTALGESPEQYRGLIRYSVNSKGEVKCIETPSDISWVSPDAEDAAEKNIFRKSFEGSFKWRSTPKCFDSYVWVKPSTVIFSVPDGGDDEDIRLIGTSVLNADRSYDFTAYDMDKNMNAGVIVLTGDISNEISYTSNFMIVKSKVTALDYYGENSSAIRGWWNGKEFSFTVDSDDAALMETYNSLRKGDVVLFGFGVNDDIVSLKRYSLDEKGYYNVTSPYAVFNIAGGIAHNADYENGHIGVNYSADGELFGFIYNNSTVVYIYDKSDDMCIKGSIYDIVKNDRLIVKMRYLSANEIIVIKD